MIYHIQIPNGYNNCKTDTTSIRNQHMYRACRKHNLDGAKRMYYINFMAYTHH